MRMNAPRTEAARELAKYPHSRTAVYDESVHIEIELQTAIVDRDKAVHFCSQLSKELAQNDKNYKVVVNLVSDERDVLRKFYFAFKHQKGECWCIDGTCLIHESEKIVQNFYEKEGK